ncbi:hypothetical protein [Mycobacteroides franklinii]|uniref:Uncharacterized protein n=1 Tax=Mycobacteroides franklinii TaxID=948102 RepID=A0A4R5P6B4_9MYCO|nr:hypothetical protein [Mycobacteroides franklinii]ORA62175.1 hypothetical protein BST24_08510 [Mycobacteroides franklinii]TDH18972.1 hypothetical protein EJ571_20530 [Mycobacteroides franklinii]
MSRTGKFTACGGLKLRDLQVVSSNAVQLGYSPDASVWISKPDAAGDVIVTVTDPTADPADVSAASGSTGPETTTTARR